MKANTKIDRDSFGDSSGGNCKVVAKLSLDSESIVAIEDAVSYCRENNIDVIKSLEIIKYTVDSSICNVTVSAKG